MKFKPKGEVKRQLPVQIHVYENSLNITEGPGQNDRQQARCQVTYLKPTNPMMYMYMYITTEAGGVLFGIAGRYSFQIIPGACRGLDPKPAI